jgi:hypothetical protein
MKNSIENIGRAAAAGAIAFGLAGCGSKDKEVQEAVKATVDAQEKFESEVEAAVSTRTAELGIAEQGKGEVFTPTPRTETTQTVTQEDQEEVNTEEELRITLDEFGQETRYDDRFPTNGMIWDQSYNAGEIFVANAFAIHDHDFRSQEGCVVAYYQAPEKGGRIRFTGWDGMGFELNAESDISLNQAIGAMRETLTRAHECDVEDIQFHELIPHGDAVK